MATNKEEFNVGNSGKHRRWGRVHLMEDGGRRVRTEHRRSLCSGVHRRFAETGL